MTHEAKFKVGDIVLACHSGKAKNHGGLGAG